MMKEISSFSNRAVPNALPLVVSLLSLAVVSMVGCGGGGPTSKLTDRGTPKAEYKAAVEAAANDGVVVTCDGEGEVTFLDFHAHPNVSAAAKHVESFPNLSMLNFSSSKLQDADMSMLANAVHVQQLGLHGTEVTDAGLEHLAKLTKLEQLNLTDTGVTDAGLQHLHGLKSLVRLDLQNTKVTDAGLQHLQSLPDLMYVELSNCPVSEEAVEQLRSKFPDAQIINEEIVDTSDVPMLTDAELPDV